MIQIELSSLINTMIQIVIIKSYKYNDSNSNY